MSVYLSLIAMALAVSLDGFGAGIMYGVRKIKIPWTSVAIVALCSGVVIYASMAAGSVIVRWLPEAAARSLGGVTLIAIGIWAVYQMLKSTFKQSPDPDEPAPPTAAELEEKTIIMWEIRRLGLIIKIWKTPSVADVDRSGEISAAEAVLLGAALSLDSFGAGIGAALIGLPPLATAALIALSSGAFIAWGSKLGLAFSAFRWVHKMSLLPGCILILMGIFKLL